MGADMDVDLQKLLALHRTTFPIETPEGLVVMRALPKLQAKRIHQFLCGTEPEYEELMMKIDYLKKISRTRELQGLEPVLNVDQARELAVLKHKVAPFMDHFSVGCFVKPKMTNPEDVWALADSLPNDIWKKISILIVVLSNPVPIQEKHFEFIRLCKDYGIPIAEDLTAEVMTVHQSYMLSEASRQESKEMQKILGDLL
jgi:hypothetical protein